MLPGLALVPGWARRFVQPADGPALRIPLMGWAELELPRPSGLFADPGVAQRFYFVHSYHVVCADTADVAAYAHHGRRFVAAVERGRLFGVQFHPEKSHRYGMQLLKTFSQQVVACEPA